MGSGKKAKSTAQAAAQAPAFLGDKDGVVIRAAEVDGKPDGYLVTFAFDRQVAKMIRDLPGTVFNKEAGGYHVPASSELALDKMADAMRAEVKAVAADLENIKALATASGISAQKENQSDRAAKPQVSFFREIGKFYGGEVVNATGNFIAQLSGFGKEDGAAFVHIHRIADLNRGKIMKGDHLGIKYDDKYIGHVTDLAKFKPDAQLEADYKTDLGKEVDGVTITDRGDKVGVAFTINPVMVNRIRIIEGAAFHATDKVWEIPQANREYALRAVQDMRHEFVADRKDVAMLQELAESKIDGAKVSKAFTKDNHETFGKVVAVSDRYVLQNAGRDKFTLHHLASLSHKPEIDQNLSIKYQRGVGAVVDTDKQRAQQKAMGR